MDNLALETVLQLVIGMERCKLSGLIPLSFTDNDVFSLIQPFTPKAAMMCVCGGGGWGGGGVLGSSSLWK